MKYRLCCGDLDDNDVQCRKLYLSYLAWQYLFVTDHLLPIGSLGLLICARQIERVKPLTCWKKNWFPETIPLPAFAVS